MASDSQQTWRGAETVWAALRLERLLQEHDGSGVVVFRDGTYAAAVAVYPPNFAMLTEDAVDAILDYVLRPALNRLDFPFSVTVRARRPDLTAWLEARRQRRSAEETSAVMLRLGLELDSLLEASLTTRSAVEREMAVVIPYTAEGEESESVQLLKKGRGRQRKEGGTTAATVPAEVLRQLALRCDSVADVLRRFQCQVVRMGIVDLAQWFYETYCPDRAQLQPLDAQSLVGLSTPLVTLAQARVTGEV